MIRTGNVSDYYLPFLVNLSDDVKLDIIERLTVSMRKVNKAKKTRPDITKCFSGDWDNDKTTNEVVNELRNSRYYEQKKITW